MKPLKERIRVWLSQPQLTEGPDIKLWELMNVDPYTWAIRLLRQPLAVWQEEPSSAKKELMTAYAKLHPDLVAALDKANRKAIGSSTMIGWRWSRDGKFSSSLGGMSLHADIPFETYTSLKLSQLAAYEVKASDVLTHYATPENPLGNARYAHEQEVILKPDAKPKMLSADETERLFGAHHKARVR